MNSTDDKNVELLRGAIERTERGMRWGHGEQENIAGALKAVLAVDRLDVSGKMMEGPAELRDELKAQHSSSGPAKP